MTIRTLFRSLVVFALFFFSGSVGYLGITYLQETTYFEKDRRVAEALLDISRMQALVQEHVANDNPWVDRQLGNVISSLRNRLQDLERDFGKVETQSTLRSFVQLETLLADLETTKYSSRSLPPKERAISLRYEERLRGQISVHVHMMLNDVVSLSSKSAEEGQRFLHRSGLALLLFSVGLIIVVVIAALALRWKVYLPLGGLHRQMVAIGSGEKNARLTAPHDDEIGDLAQGVNHMLDGLAERATSIENLNRAIDSLRRSEEMNSRLGRILDQSSNEIFLFDETTLKFETVNAGARANIGYDMDELREMTPLDIKPEFTAERFEAMIAPLRRGEQEALLFETVHQRKDGSLYPVHVRLQLTRDEERPVFVAIIRDINEEVEAQLLNRRLIAAIDQADEAIFVTDVNGAIIYFNPAFARQSGYEKEEILGSSPRILKSGAHNQRFYEEMWKTLSEGKVWQGRITNRRKDDGNYEVEAVISPVFDAKGNICNFIANQRDITVQLTLEKQLRQSQKMQAVGTLAGGIAHDFNNILTAIVGFAEIAKEEARFDNQTRDDIEEILISADRAKRLVHQILTFSRQSETARQRLSLHLIVKEALKLLRATLPTTINIREQIETVNDTVVADPTQMSQVIMNLGANAEYVMRETGGDLTVILEPFEVDEDYACLHDDLTPGPYLRLAVSDTGPGIPPEDRERIFEPFYTTKPVGEGTGMGLAVAHGIIRSHGGAIRVYSDPLRGTTFQVYLPRVASTKEEEQEETPAPLPRGNERIILIDDEPTIIRMAGRMLKHLGYTVTATGDPLEALDLLRKHPDDFDLVITDQTMPGMTGMELIRRVHERLPHLPIILCTGYSHLVNETMAEESGVAEYVTKPYSNIRIATAIRNALAKRPPPA